MICLKGTKKSKNSNKAGKCRISGKYLTSTSLYEIFTGKKAAWSSNPPLASQE
jgi:hypothetical protein